ncbi:MerR family transcriptional regulator [Peterkaempfera bronchialis]|uniref:MerR family transcriptional regulator n=1 Tax=Peterkaempfera bronchialis TaxID=2126346 RepID=A0A345SUP1_9ACTN|nr:MerR family transcriptional regulator [Peterkaempfera bronchialis]AXI77446.1 MerR family transcriptional regulator [Peterkaempfera bronchialis]
MAVARPITRPVVLDAPAAVASCADAPPGGPGADDTPRHTIGEVAARSGLTAHTLRWYERIGLLERIDRSYSGQRRYSDKDLGWLAFLGKLRLTGMSVADMVRYAELVRAGDHTFAERHELLRAHREEVRQRITDLQTTLAVLDHKIGFYSDAAPAAEGNRTA